MTNPLSSSLLPHHKLVAYRVCVELAHAVRDARVRDTKLRDEATRAVKGACLNIAEAASRGSRADQARAGECLEPEPEPALGLGLDPATSRGRAHAGAT